MLISAGLAIVGWTTLVGIGQEKTATQPTILPLTFHVSGFSCPS